MLRLQLTLLGGFQARLEPGKLLDISAKKTRGLLAYLALPPGREHSRDKLMGLLWSDRGDKQARSSLRQALTELSQEFGSDGASLLVKGRDTLALDPNATEVDAVLFEQLASSEDHGELRRAAALYAGELLEGFGIRDQAFEDWLANERRRNRELAISVFRKLACREKGAEALAAGQRLLALDPLQEEGHRFLMQHLCRLRRDWVRAQAIRDLPGYVEARIEYRTLGGNRNVAPRDQKSIRASY